jgi:hypothetical protein
VFSLEWAVFRVFHAKFGRPYRDLPVFSRFVVAHLILCEFDAIQWVVHHQQLLEQIRYVQLNVGMRHNRCLTALKISSPNPFVHFFLDAAIFQGAVGTEQFSSGTADDAAAAIGGSFTSSQVKLWPKPPFLARQPRHFLVFAGGSEHISRRFGATGCHVSIGSDGGPV